MLDIVKKKNGNETMLKFKRKRKNMQQKKYKWYTKQKSYKYIHGIQYKIH